MSTWPQSLLSNPVLAGLIADVNRLGHERIARDIAADPRKHKLVRTMANTNYRYWPAGTNGHGHEVNFCWSTHRNVAGYFLGWREVLTPTGGKRDQWTARKTRDAVREIARCRQNAFIDKATA